MGRILHSINFLQDLELHRIASELQLLHLLVVQNWENYFAPLGLGFLMSDMGNGKDCCNDVGKCQGEIIAPVSSTRWLLSFSIMKTMSYTPVLRASVHVTHRKVN